MNPDSSRPKQSFAPRFLGLEFRLSSILLSASLLIPSIGVFCYQWTSSKTSAVTDEKASSALVLSPRINGAAEQSAQFASLRPVQNPRYGFAAEGSAEDPFAAAVNRAMLTAQDDPFFYAALTGRSETAIFGGRSSTLPR